MMLPGRTDNEIKNFWNTRIKRRQRSGLPIYPPELHVQAQIGSQDSEDMVTSHDGDTHHSDASQSDGFDIPDVEFKHLEVHQGLLNCCSGFVDIPTNSLFQKSLGSSPSYGFTFPSWHPHKRLRETGTTRYNGSVTSTSNAFPIFDQYEDETFEEFAPMQSLLSPFNNPDLNINPPSPFEVPGSHALINGNFSSSEPLSEAMKLELPSLQFSASQVGGWPTPSSPLPSLEPVDTLIQSPLSEHTQSNCPSPRSSGLLEAIVYGSKSSKGLKNGDGVELSSQNVHETKWDASGDPISPLSQSAASVFVEHTPVSGGSSTDELQSTKTVTVCKIKREAADWLSAESETNKDVSCRFEYLRPDALLDSFCSGHYITSGKDQLITADVGALFDDDLNFGYQPSESNQTSGARS